jgi:hypothetical protein
MSDEGDRPFGARHGWSLRERVRAPDSFGVLLILIVVFLICAAVLGPFPEGQVLTIALQGTVLVYAVWTSRAGRHILRGALVVVPLIVVIAAALTGSESKAAVATVTITTAALAVTAMAAIVRRLLKHPRIDAATVLGALSTYLLIGEFFAAIYATLSVLGNQQFFVSQADPASIDFLYFSFITMTTVGYGDFTAATDVGRMLAVSEALVGQLYLVSIVALVIGNVGRTRRLP